MKIGVIPDVHGCVGWKKNIEKLKDCEKIVFLGDYVDSFNENERGLPALENVKEIVKAAKEDPRIDLLVGNHEFENYWFGHGRCSGFQLNSYPVYHEFFEENADMFKIAVEYGGWVFSHAGFTKTWVNSVFSFYKSRIDNFEFDNDPIKFSNQLLKTKNVELFQYYDYDMSGYGSNTHQGPLWVRPPCLLKDPYYDKQVIGHTETSTGEVLALKTENAKVILCDTQSHAKYYILDTENLPEFLSLEDC